MNPEQQKQLFDCAKNAGALGDSMLKSFSGADQADSEVYFCERRVYVAVAQGTDLEAALTVEDARWRAYAAGQARKVADAPKVKRGPMSGHSAISHRWVSPDLFQSRMNHIRFMVRRSLGETTNAA